MTKFMIHLFGFGSAQSITTKKFDGENWYMASDICGLIGIKGHSAAVLKHLNYNEFRKESTYIGGYGKKHILLINNSGVIKLINAAKNENAPALRERLLSTPLDKLPEVQQHLLQKAA